MSGHRLRSGPSLLKKLPIPDRLSKPHHQSCDCASDGRWTLSASTMMTIGIHRDERSAQPVQSTIMVRQIVLACGLLSSLLYIATDIAGGLRYEGYSFWSQAISELAAVGAPSQPFVVPLFLAYGVLALAFGIGVFREAGDANPAL